ncbi:MAG: hypothetical protein PHR65_09720, partial [Syntrophomonadaceae bacterium]|nr:hypothetical protein [Syntrophomonadaceae bacterium]
NTAPGVAAPTAPPAGGGGGGGGSSAVAVTALNVELTGLGNSQTVASNGVTFNLSGKADTAVATQMKITTTPEAAITNATLTISSIKTRGIEFLSTPITVATSNGVVTIGQLLGALAADDDVSLGALRTIFGNQDIIIKGKISKAGYTFNSGNEMTITIQLGAGGNAVINNAYVRIEDTGAGTATVTIKEPTATVGSLKGTGFDFAAVVVSVVGGSQYTDGTTTDNFKAAVESFINSGAFDSLTLGQLIGKTVTFSGYTVSFVGE